MPEGAEPRYIHDLGTGRAILLSPHRQARPRNTGPDQDGSADCPFCPGAEAMTPPEVDAVRAPDSAPDTPGWLARAFPNLYPAATWHEVIAEGAAHHTHPADLSHEELTAALQLWQRRIAWLETQPEVACAFLFKNVGAAAGASIAHNHSQLLGLPEIPPRIVQERDACAQACLHCAEIGSAAAEDRVIAADADFVLLCPSTPKLPFETWLLPRDHGSRFCQLDAAAIDRLSTALARAFRALHGAFAGGPFNFWLHRIPDAEFHWHFELQPRIGNVAALELGADMYINALPPAQAAARLAAAL